ncbi:2Fe-2S iron-sulfur cluster-binding protein [Streptomyces sp. NPDC002845]
MTDDQHGEGTPQEGAQGGWERLPQGDYDDGATTFVQLPEGGIEALLGSDSPLAAPGSGYVPPPITVTPAPPDGTDPAATGNGWAVPAEGAQWPDPNAVPQGGAQDGFAYNPGATGQWSFEGVTQGEATPGHDVTGEWSIPVAGGDLPDESGEFSASSLVEQWGGTPPATLPGGAPAPWVTEGPGTNDAPGTTDTNDAPGATGTPGANEAIGTAWTAPPPRPAEAQAPAPPAGAPVEAAGAPSAEPYAETPAGNAVEAPEGAQEASEAVGAPWAADADGAPEAPEVTEAPEPDAAEGEPTAEVAERGEPEADTPDPGGEPSALPSDEHPLASYVLRVNSTDRPVTDAWIGESLLYVLRERLGLAGAKDGCSQGECGACNVQVDGRLVASCLVPAVTAAGSEVRTVEGLAVDGAPSDVQRALAKCGAVQCGFCIPGMAMTVHDLLEGNPAPSELETRQALCGNLCRCSGYRGVLDAVREVVAEREAHVADAAGAEPEQDPDEARIPHQAGPGEGGVNPAAYDPAYDSPAQHDQPYGQDGGGQA